MRPTWLCVSYAPEGCTSHSAIVEPFFCCFAHYVMGRLKPAPTTIGPAKAGPYERSGRLMPAVANPGERVHDSCARAPQHSCGCGEAAAHLHRRTVAARAQL